MYTYILFQNWKRRWTRARVDYNNNSNNNRLRRCDRQNQIRVFFIIIIIDPNYYYGWYPLSWAMHIPIYIYIITLFMFAYIARTGAAGSGGPTVLHYGWRCTIIEGFIAKSFSVRNTHTPTHTHTLTHTYTLSLTQPPTHMKIYIIICGNSTHTHSDETAAAAVFSPLIFFSRFVYPLKTFRPPPRCSGTHVEPHRSAGEVYDIIIISYKLISSTVTSVSRRIHANTSSFQFLNTGRGAMFWSVPIPEKKTVR